MGMTAIRKQLLLGMASIVLATPAFAQSDPILSTGFYPYSEEAPQLGLDPKSESATVGLSFPNGPSGGGPSEVISDDGTIITAWHVLYGGGPFAPEGSVTPEQFKKSLRQEFQFIPEDEGPGIKEYSNAPWNAGKKITTYKVVAASQCPSPAYGKDYVSPENERICKHPGSDFVILKPVTPPEHPVPCYRISTDPVPLGQPLATIGYPDHTYRKKSDPNAHDADTKPGPSISFGSRVNQPYCTYEGGPSDPNNGSKIDLSTFFPNDFMQTTLDIWSGSSGGAVVRQDNWELVGVVSNIVGNVAGAAQGVHSECLGSALVVPMTDIVAAVKEQGIDPKTLFSCSNPIQRKPAVKTSIQRLGCEGANNQMPLDQAGDISNVKQKIENSQLQFR
jgi:hypothetical protein